MPVLSESSFGDGAEVADDARIVERVEAECDDELRKGRWVLDVLDEARDGLYVFLDVVAFGADSVHANDELRQVLSDDRLCLREVLHYLLGKVLHQSEALLKSTCALGRVHVDKSEAALQESFSELADVKAGVEILGRFKTRGGNDEFSRGNRGRDDENK